ncbi:MAG TPA: hypothetical protein VMQ54_02185, partial [Steroidobacteraceae bacterium]|nr:hypothetical protein [Steroidobacteraceae bacterium]
MNYIRSLILLASLVLPAKSAIANVLSLADYDNFHNLAQRTRTLEKDIHDLGQPGTPVDTFHCLIELNDNLYKFYDSLDPLVSLVSLASVMVDATDEKAVIHVLSSAAPYFLKSLGYSRRGINNMVAMPDFCPQNNAVSAKTQKILRILP